jgi:hypothetical protein
MLLTWQTAFKIALACVVFAVVLTRVPRRWAPPVSATLKETSLVIGLYALWQYAHDLAVTKATGARDHALWLWHLEQRLHIGIELGVQKALIGHRLVMEFLNVYYAVMHVPVAAGMLIWLFFRHRARYARVRTTFALTIFGCLLIQMIPMAPPRFFPELGFVDSGLLYGQSVYGAGGSGLSNQVAAMPSHHVGWALLVGIAVVAISTSKWRWLALAHTFLTVLAVTATANHWLLDGVVAGMVMAVVYALQLAAAAARDRVRVASRRRAPVPAVDPTAHGHDPAPVLAEVLP